MSTIVYCQWGPPSLTTYLHYYLSQSQSCWWMWAVIKHSCSLSPGLGLRQWAWSLVCKSVTLIREVAPPHRPLNLWNHFFRAYTICKIHTSYCSENLMFLLLVLVFLYSLPFLYFLFSRVLFLASFLSLLFLLQFLADGGVNVSNFFNLLHRLELPDWWIQLSNGLYLHRTTQKNADTPYIVSSGIRTRDHSIRESKAVSASYVAQ